MSNEDKAEAAEHAGRAATQARHAAKNAAAAASNGASAIADDAEEVVGAVKDAAQGVDVKRFAFIASDLGVGFLALSASIGGAILASRKFRDAWNSRP